MIDAIFDTLVLVGGVFGFGFLAAAVLGPLDHDLVCACRCGRETTRRFAHFTDDDVEILEAALTDLCPYCSAKEPSAVGPQG